MSFKPSDPIGVFDSGLGGLTMLKALQKFLPEEQFIYYGDTAHLPYGDKSESALISYVEQITGFLRMRSCKFVLIACNSASTVLGKANVPYTDDEILEVISPIVNLIAQQDKYHHIGVIGTRKTILSGMFDRQLHKLNPDLEIVSRATPLLVPMIEEGFSDAKTLFPVFDRYFKEFEKTELLIPACTHFPLIYKEIESYFNQSLKVLHTPKIIAETVRDLLQKQDLLSTVGERELDEYHLSDLTDDFKREAEMFLGRRIELKQTLLNQG